MIFLLYAPSLSANQQQTLGEKLSPKIEQLAKTTSSWNGAQLPGYGIGQPEVTILKITIPPKAQLPIHKHPVINAGVLIKGSLKVITKTGDELELSSGDAIVEVVDTWHYGRNEGNEPAEIIVFYAGTINEKLSVIK
ncbi:hypothetical protein JCM19239_4495 [Vibrio variabilis]|uniref:Cupin type-2 domain-containing protein n=1 Tax=Vibrio variabilis TaxID=990271 RepID=A0ABQ0JQS6_9VIBR|nr:hypothetical protein JCM19239_4495 [Vibrio variabilis]